MNKDFGIMTPFKSVSELEFLKWKDEFKGNRYLFFNVQEVKLGRGGSFDCHIVVIQRGSLIVGSTIMVFHRSKSSRSTDWFLCCAFRLRGYNGLSAKSDKDGLLNVTVNISGSAAKDVRKKIMTIDLNDFRQFY